MTITNYWWEIIWIVLAGAFLSYVFPRRDELVEDRLKQCWLYIPAFILAVPYVIWAGFRTTSWGDTGAYRQMFLNAPGSLRMLGEYLETVNKDKGFAVLTVLIKCFAGGADYVYLLLIAVIQMGILVLIYRKYSENYWVSIFLFIASCEYMSWMHNGIRQFLAVMIIFAATPLLLKKKYIPLIGVILLASTIHASALIMIPIVFIVQGDAWNIRTILMIIAAGFILIWADQFTEILDYLLSNTQYSSVVLDWTEWKDDGMSPIRVLVYAIPTILALLGYNQIREEGSDMINVMVNFSIMTTVISLISMATSGIFLGRLAIYSSVYSNGILLPWEIRHLFRRSSVGVMTAAMAGGYILFFIYQMHVSWGLI